MANKRSQGEAVLLTEEELREGEEEVEDEDAEWIGESDDEGISYSQYKAAMAAAKQPSKPIHTMTDELIHKLECIFACQGCNFVTLDTKLAVDHAEFHEAAQRAAALSLDDFEPEEKKASSEIDAIREKLEKKAPPRPAPLTVPLPVPAPKPTLQRQQSMDTDTPEMKQRVQAHIARRKEFEAKQKEAKAAVAPVPMAAAPLPKPEPWAAPSHLRSPLAAFGEEKAKPLIANSAGADCPPKPVLTAEERLQAHLARVKQMRSGAVPAGSMPVPAVPPLTPPPQCTPLANEFFFFPCPHCEGKITVKIAEINCARFKHAAYLSGECVSPYTPKDVMDQLLRNNQVLGCGQGFRLLSFEGTYKAVKADDF
jgi:hypothetical protein